MHILRGVKTLLTLNTIMKDVEIDSAYYNISRIYEHGIDAVIVQDLGFVKFLKENFPELTIHGSTQMTVANHVEANKLKELGLSRVVLARELSFEEIKSIREKTDIELEIFVSGSLCIAYSGNCYISSFYEEEEAEIEVFVHIPAGKSFRMRKGIRHIS